MKSLAIIGAVLAIAVASAANATPPDHSAGGPIKHGKYCWIATTLEGAGFWQRCNSELVRSLRGRPNEVLTFGDGGADGGAGGNR